MNQMQQSVVLADLIDRLAERGSRSCEWDVQDAAYFLEYLLGVPLGFGFIWYKFGPHSFELDEELGAMVGDYMLTVQSKREGSYPSLVTTPTSVTHRKRYTVLLAQHAAAIDFVARVLGPKVGGESQQLASALFVTRELGEGADVHARANRIDKRKPHVAMSYHMAAVEEFDRIAAQAKELLAARVATPA